MTMFFAAALLAAQAAQAVDPVEIERAIHSNQLEQAAPSTDPAEIEHAIESNRLEQARQMLAMATAEGNTDPRLAVLRADLSFALKSWSDARSRYLDLANADPGDARSAERAGIASIMTGDMKAATRLLNRAASSGGASWRGWNALGVIHDFEGNWAKADEAFEKAQSLSPEQPEILNNRGWSLLLRGEWARALPVLEQASLLDPNSARCRNNLELARAAIAENLPARMKGESDSDYAARLNDAGVVAAQRGEKARAIAAFSQALAASDSWFPRAANNLAAVQQ